MIAPSVPNALLLGIWVAEKRAALTAAVRDECGHVCPDVLLLTGEPWTTVVQALEQAALMDVSNIVILSNDPALVSALSPPLAAPEPDRRERVWLSRADWVDIPSGGNPDHWQVVRFLGGRWGGRFRAMQVDDLPKARELWQSKQQQ